MVWQRDAFWGQCGNLFDVSVSALSIVCFCVYMADIDQELEVVFLTLMVVWVALRLARLATVAKNLHSQRRFSAMQVTACAHGSAGVGCSVGCVLAWSCAAMQRRALSVAPHTTR